MSSEPIASAPQPGEAPPAEFIADAELVLAALNRMEAAVHADRAALAKLRPALAELAVALGSAKRAVTLGAERPLDVAMLLDVLEHRVDAMIEIAGGEPVPQPLTPPPIEPAAPRAEYRLAESRVPTVSDVVSRLGRGDDPHADTPEAGPSVSELQAMVQALSAPPPEADAGPEPAAMAPLPPPQTQPAPAIAPETAETIATADPSPHAAADGTRKAESAWLARAELQAPPAPWPETAVFVLAPALDWPAPSVGPAEPQAAVAVPAAAAAPSEATRDPDIDDLAALLFEPDLDRPAGAETKAGPQQPGPPVAAMTPIAAASTQVPEPKQSSAEQPSSHRHDPLAPLNAMSPEERLALFS